MVVDKNKSTWRMVKSSFTLWISVPSVPSRRPAYGYVQNRQLIKSRNMSMTLSLIAALYSSVYIVKTSSFVSCKMWIFWMEKNSDHKLDMHLHQYLT